MNDWARFCQIKRVSMLFRIVVRSIFLPTSVSLDKVFGMIIGAFLILRSALFNNYLKKEQR